MEAQHTVREGTPMPWGAHARGPGVNFSIFCRAATGMRLEFFARPEDGQASWGVDLDPDRHRTGDVWHVWVGGVESGQLYGYRARGPYRPAQGYWFNPRRLLLDPCGLAVAAPMGWDFAPAGPHGARSAQGASELPPPEEAAENDDAGAMPKSVYCHAHFDWEGDHPLRLAAAETIIYETHVRGCTRHPSAGVPQPGTYQALVEKIPYFLKLGVTALELMPVQEFNAADVARMDPGSGARLRDYWGYNPVSMFAPKAGYAAVQRCGEPRNEFRAMVKAFHRAGMEIILDIVLNHTAEGDASGPTFCLRGLDNPIYYMLEEADPRRYKEYSGVGNTLNANHPVVREWILYALRTWVMDLHVDGFRFDLASVLGRDKHGAILANAPLLEQIAEDPILRDTKLIAEAWDAGGAYQVGQFSERRWAEWNGRYRDDVRRFWRGDGGMAGAFASRLCGSADLYQRSGKGPECSVNFVTCHDGFTLNDLVSYSQKHNQANGENNADGSDANYSSGYGAEGAGAEAGVEGVRRRQIRNFLATLLLSRGIPMLLGGDEFRRTQQGNNNAYCQDNELSWVDWGLAERNADLVRFTRGLIGLRRRHAALRREAFYSANEIQWFGPNGGAPQWQDGEAGSVACLIWEGSQPDLFLVFHARAERATYRLPQAAPGTQWQVAVDTGREPPQEFYEAGSEPAVGGAAEVEAGPQSTLVLVCRAAEAGLG
ncbi:MAG TPA: glycogen debranching protein GlgX [Terriglobales bacterium]|nr:glycogen debranching protein GlgX [Terriglobales bacterium]